MSDLQAHLDSLETHIDALPTETQVWQDLVDALGEVFFLLNELKDIAVATDSIYDK